MAFRDRLRATPILVGDLTLRLTVSAGVALREGGDSFDRLYSRADRALYEAKAAGRNRFLLPAVARAAGQQDGGRLEPGAARGRGAQRLNASDEGGGETPRLEAARCSHTTKGSRARASRRQRPLAPRSDDRRLGSAASSNAQ